MEALRIGDGPSQIKAVWYAHVIVGLITGTLEKKQFHKVGVF